jgi:hypothetical protein
MADSSQRVVSVGCEDGLSRPLLIGRTRFVQGVGNLYPYFVSLRVPLLAAAPRVKVIIMDI